MWIDTGRQAASGTRREGILGGALLPVAPTHMGHTRWQASCQWHQPSTAFHRKRDYDCWTENPFSVLKPVPRKD
ncbi:MAG: hypothetical protein JXQ75_11655, partial [Phycisphaerae bacterium]|nr:hypothetical protein [Phycisphaerae bacterium]